MFPLKDTAPNRSFSFINWILILLNIYVFYLQLTVADPDGFILRYAFIPGHFDFGDPQTYYNLISSIFMHGGFMHIIGNMWFLFIFGDNVEDSLGHLPYLLFYLAGGIVATLTQYMIDPTSAIPVIGASGAISAVAGMYIVFYRNSRIRTLVFLFFGLINIVDLPVWLFLGYWFLVQLLSGIGSLGSIDANYGGVAFFAHIGGFIFGFLASRILPNKNKMVEEGRLI